ncbi:hypothetical protein JCM8547_008468 [Rhodosporidiobolus lusitaniae]
MLLRSLPLLSLLPLAFAQNSTSASAAVASATGTSSSASPSGSVSNGTTYKVSLPAYGTSSEGETNATLQAVWSTETGRGTMRQGLTLLQNSTGTAQNESVYGVFLQFNSSLAISNESTTTQIPWIAYISCDSSLETVTVSSSSNSTSASATSAATSSAAIASSSAVVNGTAAMNGTAGVMQVELMNRAEELGARAIVLYSESQQSCVLNRTAFNPTTSANSSNSTVSTSQNTTTLPIFSTSSPLTSIISQQFSNLPLAYTYFNSTLLTASTGNLTALLSSVAGNTSSSDGVDVSGVTLTSPSDYLLAQLVPSYAESASDNGIVATIGHASPTSSSGPAASGSMGSGGSGGSNAASGRRVGRSRWALAATGFVVGGVIGGVGMLV